jgi:signal transduction histidine kinase
VSEEDGAVVAVDRAAVAAEVRAEQGSAWPRYAVDVLFALGLFGMYAIYIVFALQEQGLLPALPGIAGALASLLLVPSRREHPVRFLLVLLATAGYLSVITGIPALIFIGPVGLFCLEAYGRSGWVRRWVGPAIAVLLVGAAAYGSPPLGGLVAGVTMVSILGWARGVRVQRDYRRSLLERIAVAEREQDLRAAQAVAAERNRIAQDIHDLVSHSLAVVAVQAAGAERIVDRDPDRAKQALVTIRTSARDALTEMRAMLEVLRSGDPAAEAAAPSPGVPQIAELTQDISQRGLSVDYERAGDPYPLAPGAELALYRVVQEGLTNAVKHGDRAAGAAVSLRYGPDAVTVEITSALPATEPGALEEAVPGSGSGQVGMRERLALYGGDLRIDRDDRRYRVRATVPRAGGAGR